VLGILEIRSCFFCQDWLQTSFLLICASGVARITGVSHWHPAKCSPGWPQTLDPHASLMVDGYPHDWPIFSTDYLFIYFWWDWGLNSQLCMCKADALWFQPHLQSSPYVFFIIFQ
jgi:hypothetical protein